MILSIQKNVALYIDSPAQYIKGVGPKLGTLLKKKGLATVRDLLEFYPRAYEDRRAARSISSLQEGEHVGLLAQVIKVSSIPMGRSRRKMYDIQVKDDTGSISCRFFRVPYRGYFERFQVGQQVRVVGKVTLYRHQLQFHHPDIHEISPDGAQDQNELVPIYSETEGLTSKKISKIIQSAIDHLGLPNQAEIIDFLPAWMLKKYQLAELGASICGLHAPQEGEADQYLQRQTPFHRRVIFEEFFKLELLLASRKKRDGLGRAPAIKEQASWQENLLKSLPFDLTAAQLRVVEEIKKDLFTTTPMNRLVQGDVGSGKTLVAVLSALHVMGSGFQCALMAPTEILAQQHYLNIKKLLEPLGLEVAFLSGSMKASEKKEVVDRLSSGQVNLAVGTHALIQDSVSFKSLGLVIVDEQHRFGVAQRSGLKRKGLSPHFLLMTATPIPRSLAMTVYGDLDCSVIDELPKGRQTIVTRVTSQSKKNAVVGFVRDQLVRGRQAYVIFPLVEESEKIDLKSAVTEFERLKVIYKEFRLGLLHGKMKSEEKDEVMRQFRDHELDMLVSTTVIEVGVDVPNANIIWIEHAERFGLSQLHQLRGRVGRGAHKSYCVLMMGHAKSPESLERVRVLENTNDGFKISEQDLEIRGPGEFLGYRQSGMPGFKMANLVRDLDILQDARTAALELFQKDPQLKKADHVTLKSYVEKQADQLS